MSQPQTHQFLTLLLFVLITGAYVLMAVYFPVAYIWATYEDLFGEWAQTYFFTAALVFSVLVASSRSPYRGYAACSTT